MKTLLITGFDSFDGASVNPSWEAVSLLPEQIGNYTLYKFKLPTIYATAPALVLEKAAALKPDVIISVGQAGKRDAVTPERIAVNIRDARICDNAGVFCTGEKILDHGDAAFFATVPVEAMRDAILAKSIPAAVSNTAGTFVCNDVLYSLLHRYRGTSVRCGFIHVPWLPEQGEPSLELEKTVAALIAAIGALDA